MEITEENNFCRIFELPSEYPQRFCFGGGIDTTFKMVDWFNPIPVQDIWDDNVKTWDEYKPLILEWLTDKVYLKPNKKYLMITNFNETFIFNKDGLC